ncbi:hypothetical protein XA68_14650 [Ophiocordyceps unilateralis]|uniref:Protein kinase domain-containing protein n=1 Tax=Ophiocordyceps unilateralis TaxID=268505 RepID=A0A2A9P9X8_OPHUN|nr:hypothetical protein XA68_14650 [Ophiocordyceps unilateralis]
MVETTAYAYPSTFAAESETSGNAASSSSGASAAKASLAGGAFASFICHVAHLEKGLQSEKSFFDEAQRKASSRTRLGHGTSFLVDRVELPSSSGDATKESRFAVIKTVRQKGQSPTQWRDVLLEIRVLLHKPIRYHPNIVRLLDIGWDNSSEIASPFPALIQEYAEFGTLARLQADSRPLPFPIKQKLCYDVGRGLSILHACGIIHGDLKHENVLVFANRYPSPAGQPYTAKVADFGGSIMDVLDGSGSHSILMNTFPYEAPEIGQKLSVDGVKKTDAFSYGMLIWRCMLDCDDVLAAIGFALPPGQPSDEDRTAMNKLKLSDQLLEGAIASLSKHATTRDLPSQSLGLIVTSLLFTLRGDPAQRALDRAQARTRGMSASASQAYVYVKEAANKKLAESQERRTPGSHGIDMDSVGYALGRVAGDDYDAQNNLPGYRPDLPHPEKGGFLFEPLKLRRLLDWEQQKDMVAEFMAAAAAPRSRGSAAGLEPWSASFFLYQSFLSGFGVSVDGAEACRWLRSAAQASEETATVDYLAGAWLVRAHGALNVPNPLTPDEQMSFLFWGRIRGHRHCSTDAQSMIQAEPETSKRTYWESRMMNACANYLSRTGGTGMPFFISRRLTRQWDTEDVVALDETVKAELGDAYGSCLRPEPYSMTNEPTPDGGYRFDAIYVNNKGHGLLHLAATLGDVEILKHLHGKYKCNINLSNQSHSDTPLTCACRSGNLSCALYLLENGADANGTEFGEESPLHCIANFVDADMDVIVPKLMAAGADMEKLSQPSRKDVRGILADWEDSGSMKLTPLGRAVLFQNLHAVEILLRYGANPWGYRTDSKLASVQPMQLAAVLTLPDILQTMLSHTEEAESAPLFDECGMLQRAHSCQLTPYDALTLQSRIIRCGSLYKPYLAQTLRILRDRRRKLGLAAQESSPGAQLCAEIALGNKDIVEALLHLGHDVDGSACTRPIRAAVMANDEDMFFSVLLRRGASLSISHDEESGQPSLLSAAATRPHYTPRGTRIVEYLLSQGVSPEPKTQQQPCALALAVRNGYFELADLFLSGTSIESLNAFHTWSDGRDSESVLGSLLSSHTNSSARAVAYLAAVHGDSTWRLEMGPQVNKVKRLSAVHVVAQCPSSEWNDYSQISARIVQHVLNMFPKPETLGEHHIHPIVGTPLSAAVLAGNKSMVALLMDSPYREDVDKSVPIEYQLGGVKTKESLTPRELASKITQDLMQRLSSVVTAATPIGLTKLRDASEIMLQLIKTDGSDQDQSPNPEEMRLVVRNRLDKVKMETDEVGSHDPSAMLPVDLSVICEEKPSGWHEGVEMTEVMAHRTFLKTFRSAEASFGDGITGVMDKAFNKRSPELRSTGG